MRKAAIFVVNVLLYVISILTVVGLLIWITDAAIRIYEAVS